MEDLIFATHNENKIKEVASILKGRFKIHSLADIGFQEEIPEPFLTIKENAEEKARVVHSATGKNCFSEDTGLVVDSLNGEPGVKSARYAGENHDFEANIDKLLTKLKVVENRDAYFITVVCLVRNGKRKFFEGRCSGRILTERKGVGGFGYDSVFVPDGDSRTFAEMDMKKKNKFSHRKKAIEKLISFLEETSESKE